MEHSKRGDPRFVDVPNPPIDRKYGYECYRVRMISWPPIVPPLVPHQRMNPKAV